MHTKNKTYLFCSVNGHNFYPIDGRGPIDIPFSKHWPLVRKMTCGMLTEIPMLTCILQTHNYIEISTVKNQWKTIRDMLQASIWIYIYSVTTLAHTRIQAQQQPPYTCMLGTPPERKRLCIPIQCCVHVEQHCAHLRNITNTHTHKHTVETTTTTSNNAMNEILYRLNTITSRLPQFSVLLAATTTTTMTKK